MQGTRAQVANELGGLASPEGPVHLLAETLARTRAMAQVSDHHRRRRSSIDADPAQHRRPGVLVGPRQGEFRSLRLKALPLEDGIDVGGNARPPPRSEARPRYEGCERRGTDSGSGSGSASSIASTTSGCGRLRRSPGADGLGQHAVIRVPRDPEPIESVRSGVAPVRPCRDRLIRRYQRRARLGLWTATAGQCHTVGTAE